MFIPQMITLWITVLLSVRIRTGLVVSGRLERTSFILICRKQKRVPSSTPSESWTKSLRNPRLTPALLEISHPPEVLVARAVVNEFDALLGKLFRRSSKPSRPNSSSLRCKPHEPSPAST